MKNMRSSNDRSEKIWEEKERKEVDLRNRIIERVKENEKRKRKKRILVNGKNLWSNEWKNGRIVEIKGVKNEIEESLDFRKIGKRVIKNDKKGLKMVMWGKRKNMGEILKEIEKFKLKRFIGE